MYGLTSQLRRSAASVGANIAEGCGRRSDGEVCRFLQIARGSAAELEYHLLLAHDLNLLGEEEFREMEREVDEVQRMLTSLIQRFRPQPVSREGGSKQFDSEPPVCSKLMTHSS
jgi:four helix bundle protein